MQIYKEKIKIMSSVDKELIIDDKYDKFNKD